MREFPAWLQHDMEAAERVWWPLNPNANSDEVARQQRQRETALADLRARITAAEALSGHDLIAAYAADQPGLYRG